MLDSWTPSAFLTSQLTETLRFSEVFAANSPLTAWRSALVAQNHIGSLSRQVVGKPSFAQQMIQPFLLDISAVSDTAVRLSERVTLDSTTDELISWNHANSLAAGSNALREGPSVGRCAALG